MALPRDPYAGLDITGEAIDARRAVVDIALGELGEQHPDKYWSLVNQDFVGHPHDKSWCGGFALWCLRTAGLCDWDWINARGFLFRLRVVSLPKPGDIAYFSQGQHHAIVRDLCGGILYSVDGNVMLFPREGVELRERRNPNCTFYSIGCLTGEDLRGPRE